MILSIGDNVECKNIQGEKIKGTIAKINERTAIVYCNANNHLVKLSHLEELGYKIDET
ncbi:hypothetical protein [Enterococcus bulliens]